MWAKISGAAGLGLIILIYSVFSFWLNSDISAAIKELLR
jgi:hypothetical protein